MPRRQTKERKVPTTQDLTRALIDPWFFADLLNFHGGSSQFGECHKVLRNWYDADERSDKRDLILMPRGHLKTTVLTVLSILHDIYVNPNIRIYVGSANQSLAKAILREVTSNLVDSWSQEHVWNRRPHVKGRLVPLMDKGTRSRRVTRREENGEFSDFDDDLLDDKKVIWRQDAIQVIRPYILKEPTVVVGSVDSPATGFHYDKLYFDDILNFDNYDKPEKIERLDTWRNDMFSVLDDSYFDDDLFADLCVLSRNAKYRKQFRRLATVGGDCTVVGTRYFKHDWYKQLIDDDSGVYRVHVENIYKNGNKEEGYLWHERWNPEIERKKRLEMSKKHFYAQYLNQIIISEDQLLPFDRIPLLHPEALRRKENTSRVWIKVPGEDDPVEVLPKLCVDPAATCNKNSDYTCMVVGGKDVHKRLFVLDIKLLKLTSDKWIREMFKLADKWNLKGATIEFVGGYGAELKQTVRRYFKEFHPISLRDYRPPNQTNKKERIEMGLDPLVSNDMLYMMVWMKGLEELVDQFNFFPNVTVHDDAPDAVEMLNENTKPTTPVRVESTVKRGRWNSKYGGAY